MASSGKIFNHIKAQLPEHKATVIEYNSSHSIERSYQTVLEKLPVDEKFSIVSHSLGGILGYLIAIRGDENINLEHLVSISTPYGGSDVAGKLKWFYPGYSVLKDIASNSNIIKEIASNPVDKCQTLCIISTGGTLPFMNEANDGVVTLKSQRKVNTTKRVEVPVNHFESVQDEQTIREIKNFVF